MQKFGENPDLVSKGDMSAQMEEYLYEAVKNYLKTSLVDLVVRKPK